MSLARWTALFVSSVCFSTPALGWGPQGHQVVADIARSHPIPTAKRHIRELLGNDDLTAVSTWADEVRAQRPETFGWHFVDVPLNASGFSQQRDRYRPDEKHLQTKEDHHNCVVDRIEMFQRVLADKNESPANRVEALKFLVHFVADLHQPLHAIGEARGGNDIHVFEFGSVQCGNGSCNLHATWDTGLIEHTNRSEEGYVAELEKLISLRNLQHERHSGNLGERVFSLGSESLVEGWPRRGRSLFSEQYRKPGRAVGLGWITPRGFAQ